MPMVKPDARKDMSHRDQRQRVDDPSQQECFQEFPLKQLALGRTGIRKRADRGFCLIERLIEQLVGPGDHRGFPRDLPPLHGLKPGRQGFYFFRERFKP